MGNNISTAAAQMLIWLWNKHNYFFFPVSVLYHLHDSVNQTRTMNHCPRINAWGSYWCCNLQWYNCTTIIYISSVDGSLRNYFFPLEISLQNDRKKKKREGNNEVHNCYTDFCGYIDTVTFWLMEELFAWELLSFALSNVKCEY